MQPPETTLTRRALLLGGIGMASASALLVACGDAADFVVVQRFPNTALTPGNVRLPISIASAAGALAVSGPAMLTGAITDSSGARVATVEAPRFGIGQAVAYWSVTATIDRPGIYSLAIDGALGDPTPFQLFDPGDVTIPTVGSSLPGFDTPTTADARGVDPICTRDPAPCPFHELTLTKALAAGMPVVYLVGTPAHCSTGTCAPGLDFLVEVSGAYAGRVAFVHAEVFADPEGTAVAPAVSALTLDYEPVIWITDATGKVTERIDIVWDAAELATLLSASLA